MKTYRLVRATQVHTILSPSDAERMLSTGDWLIATAKPKTAMAGKMRSLRARRRAAGWLSLKLWLSPAEVDAVKAIKRPKETYAELFIRLVRERGLL